MLQILPTAQKLLDELLKSNETSINRLSGAPDPTAGSSTHDMSVWCLDEQILQENILKTLSKFVAPSPHVVSDIDYLAHASSAASAEYASLLRPLRGREPEGMWNLISIVKEMFRKHDKNSIPLLKIITGVCVGLESVLQLWFLVKVSPLYNDKSIGNNNGASSNQRQNQNHTPPVHQACAILLDEIVSLWRVACLNPLLSPEELASFGELLGNWHRQTYDKLRRFCNSASDKMHLLRRLDVVYFSGLEPAINSCRMTWAEFRLESLDEFRRLCFESTLSESTDVCRLDEDKLEILFARCEALYSHGFIEHAIVLARILADCLLSMRTPDDDSDSPHVQVGQVISFQTSILWRCVLICTILLECPGSIQLALRIGLYALETPRRPVGSKALEVKLFNQEQDLILLLKRMPINGFELNVIRDRAQKIIKHSQASSLPLTSANLVPIMLASFVFDTLCLNERFNGNKADEQVGFDAAVCALGYKTNTIESDFPIYCEGIRRQKGELALSLLLTYKDDQTRLLRILDKILDRDVHVLFKAPFNPFQPNLKKIQTNHFKKYSSLINNKPIQDKSCVQQASTLVSVQSKALVPNVQLAAKPNIKYSAIDSVSSGWEESENETPNANKHLLETKYRLNRPVNFLPSGQVAGQGSSGPTSSQSNAKKSICLDSSAPETTSSDNSPMVNRKSNSWTTGPQQSLINTIDDEPVAKKSNESDDSGGESICSNQADKSNVPSSLHVPQHISVAPWADSTFTESVDQIECNQASELHDMKKHIDPKLDPSVIEDLSNALQQCNSQIRNDVLNRVIDTIPKANMTVTSDLAQTTSTAPIASSYNMSAGKTRPLTDRF